MSQGFTEQVISAGAATTAQFAELITIENDLRKKNQDAMREMLAIQGETSLADGQAQQESYNLESDQSTHRAWETGLQAGGNLGSEVGGMGGEYAYSKTDKPKQINDNLAHCQEWENLLNQKSNAHAVVQNGPRGAAPDIQGGNDLTAQQREEIETFMGRGLPPTDEIRDAVMAIKKSDPNLEKLQEKAYRNLKRARKESDNHSSGVQRRRDQLKTFVTSGSQVFQAQQQTYIAEAQKLEGEQKMLQSQASFTEQSMKQANQSISELNSTLGQGISNVVHTSDKVWESNSRA